MQSIVYTNGLQTNYRMWTCQYEMSIALYIHSGINGETNQIGL